MNYGDMQAANPYATFGTTVADAPADARSAFVKRTYSHLALAVYACAAVCWALFQTGLVDAYAPVLLGKPLFMLGVLGGFMLVSWVAESWARSDASVGKQYLGLGLYVLAESIFLCPLLWIAQNYAVNFAETQVDVISAAGVITLVMFGGLTAIAWMSGKDFSFMRAGLMFAGFAAMGLIACAAIFGFELGILFSAAMIVFASGYILYDTSNVMHHYRTDQHVAASLALFASVALLFWYVLRILIAISSND